MLHPTSFCGCLLLTFSLVHSAPAQLLSTGKLDEKTGIAWFDVRELGIEGQGWSGDALLAPFDRFPAKAEKTVNNSVWGLSRHSTGLSVRFTSDAEVIHARWSVTNAKLEMPHMPATGVSGLDLYVKNGNTWRWLANGRPAGQTTTAALASGILAGTRDYLLYLPLYNGVTSVELGIAPTKKLSKAAARPENKRKPIIFYGTSITQGGCASRPGMVHTSILGRWLDYPVVNLGFSGSGKMENEVAELMAEIDAAVYVIDCLPNISAKEVTERTGPFVQILRAKHPKTPILLVEDRNYDDAFLITSKRERNETSQAALKVEFKKLLDAGCPNLYYLEGAGLLGDDGEGTVDSSHPTDLGFLSAGQSI